MDNLISMKSYIKVQDTSIEFMDCRKVSFVNSVRPHCNHLFEFVEIFHGISVEASL